MRWAEMPSRRSTRRTHSSLIAGRSLRLRQYSASLATDQTLNGSPRSAGFDSATSTSSRSWPVSRIGGRPLGLGASSNVEKPDSLNRWTQPYAAVKWQPDRSAASCTGRPARSSAMSRYRWWIRAESERSCSLARSTRPSLLVRERKWTDRRILSLLRSPARDSIRQVPANKLERH